MNDNLPRRLDPILVAEDSIDDALLLEVVFQRARILNPLQIVRDGAEAINYLRGEGDFSNRTLYPYPILFLLDLKMPRKGGMDVLRWLSDHSPQTSLPVVVTAGAGEMREVNCAYSLGARSFLVKPLNWLDVMELLSCFRELRLAAQGENYVLEPVQATPVKPLSQKPVLCNYKPQPLDTSRLKLTDDILRLTELLAENNHEVWARDRMHQGWTYGPERNDQTREHPCLVPYRDLPESEKLVDRNVAIETIKTIFSFGLPYPVLDHATDTVRSEVIGKSLAALKKENLTPGELRDLWEEHNAVVWSQNVKLYQRAMDAALECGEAFLAFDIAAEGLKKFHGDLHLRQMQALALARTGAIGSAREIIEQLRGLGEQEEGTLGLLARSYKDFWGLASDAGPRRRHLKLSFELYSEAYRREGTYLLGINAAVTGLLYGEKENACEIAGQVEKLCRARLHGTNPQCEEAYWLQASLAESLLIQGNLSAAEQCYRAANECTRDNWRVLNRTRAQARLLLERTGHAARQLDACFKLPRVVVCWGQMFDKPEDPQMRFPFGLEGRIREQIRHQLAKMEAQIGFSSLACGADMLFAETILERGGELNIILPCSRQEFKTTCVEIIPGAKLGERFDEILAKAASVTILDQDSVENDPCIHEYCNRVMLGLALLKGRLLNLDVAPLAVWDGRAGASGGGTRDLTQFLEQRQTPLEVIRLDKILEEVVKDTFVQQRQKKAPGFTEETPVVAQECPRTIKAVLFADIIGHTRLSQQQVPRFIEHFLTSVSTLFDSLSKPPIVRNTWGDTIHAVFDEVTEAADFALALQELMQRTEWTEVGLPVDLNVRITLHAGPLYPCVDPVSGKTTFLGAHVNRLTRIEPIAPEGQIYATEAFAAISESYGIKQYTCDYIGQKELPRHYGSVPVFIVRRAPSH